MNLVEYYITILEDDIIDFRDKLGLSVKWISSARVFYISVDTEEDETSDIAFARKLDIDSITYRSLLIKNGGIPSCNEGDINFERREDAQRARDEIAFYVMIERRIKNESNRNLCPQ